MTRGGENDRVHELWDATRPFAVWVYLGALVLPALLGGVWWSRQVRGGRAAPERELSRHELAYLKGGPREVVLAAVRRLQRTGAVTVTDRGLVHAARPGRRLRDRIDNVIVTHADNVFPKSLVAPLRPQLRGVARRLESAGLLVPWRKVWRRWVTVVVLQGAVCVIGGALFVVALVLSEPAGLELLFLVCAVLAVVVAMRAGGRNHYVPTRRGTHTLVAAGLRQPQNGPRRFTALLTLLALLFRSSVPVPDSDEDDPESWSDDWSDALGSGGGSSGDSSGGGDFGGGGDSGGGGGGGDF